MDESPLSLLRTQTRCRALLHMAIYAMASFLITLFLLWLVLIHSPRGPWLETMASEQGRRANTTKERETHLEAERVPKMTSHFESLSEKVKGGEGTEAQGREFTGPRTVGKYEMYVGEEKGSSGGRGADPEKGSNGGGGKGERTQPSLEEISKARQKAQQNSVRAIRAAEERYQKAKEVGASKLEEVKDSVAPRVESAKDIALEKSQQSYATAKDTLVTAGETAADYTLQKATRAKDVVVSGGETAAHYVGEKAAAAKDASLETGKGAAGYAGEMAAELKDKALATGWGAAHYTTKKAVEATKAAAGAIQNIAHTGEKAVDYTGRKKEEALQDQAAMQSPETEEESSGGVETGEHRSSSEGLGGVLAAVGETILEIAQVTKELVIGKDPNRAGEQGGHAMESTGPEQR